MTFFVQGLNGHELMPLEKVFKEPVVEKVAAIIPEQAVDEKTNHEGGGKRDQAHAATQVYRSVDKLQQTPGAVLVEQIMSSPVVVLDPQAAVDEALMLFRKRQFRHLPIVSSKGMLIGMVSDRDILRNLGGITESYQSQARHNRGERVERLMKSPVLTATKDTDVRYVARLFVEQRVGALPIVNDGELKGIIARSDVLKAVMQHFVLDWWA